MQYKQRYLAILFCSRFLMVKVKCQICISKLFQLLVEIETFTKKSASCLDLCSRRAASNVLGSLLASAYKKYIALDFYIPLIAMYFFQCLACACV